MSDKSMMFELWTECNNRCRFCYLGHNNQKTPDDIKIANITRVQNLIDEHFKTETEQYKAIGLIGGEFFQGQMNNFDVNNAFFNLCKDIFHLIEEDKVRDFWCYCTLTIGDQEDLYRLIDMFDKMITDKDKHKFWILVSYDTYGRFHTPALKDNWNKHMLNLQKYPFILFNVTSILSQDFCEKVISGEHDLVEFKKKYKCTYFFKQPTKTFDEDSNAELEAKLPNWFLKRKTYIEFLKKVKGTDLELFNEILNIEQRADDLMTSMNKYDEVAHRNKITWEESGGTINPKCGHVINYQCYIDSDACCLCDYFKVKGVN